MTYEIIEIQNSEGKVLETKWLEKAESVHRQLRADLSREYVQQMLRVFSEGGRMIIATLDNEVVGLAVYRIYENTASGKHLYVDDLVTDQSKRSLGVGKLILENLQVIAQAQQCRVLTLDSANHRQEAHKFYHREGFSRVASHFAKYF